MDTSQLSGTLKKAKDTTRDALAKANDPLKKDAPPTQFFTKDGKSYTKKDLKHVWLLRKEGSDIPLSLRHVPRPHGPDWCHAGCAERKGVPQSCGFHIGWGSVIACSPDCNGGYCDHYQEDDYYAEQDDGKFKRRKFERRKF